MVVEHETNCTNTEHSAEKLSSNKNQQKTKNGKNGSGADGNVEKREGGGGEGDAAADKTEAN